VLLHPDKLFLELSKDFPLTLKSQSISWSSFSENGIKKDSLLASMNIIADPDLLSPTHSLAQVKKVVSVTQTEEKKSEMSLLRSHILVKNLHFSSSIRLKMPDFLGDYLISEFTPVHAEVAKDAVSLPTNSTAKNKERLQDGMLEPKLLLKISHPLVPTKSFLVVLVKFQAQILTNYTKDSNSIMNLQFLSNSTNSVNGPVLM